MLRTVWPPLRRMSCLNRNCQERGHRSGVVASFPPSGRTSNHHSSVSDLPGMLGARPTSCFMCAREGAHACLFSLLRFVPRCAFFFFLKKKCRASSGVLLALSCAASSFKCVCVSSWRSRSVFEDFCVRGHQEFHSHGHGLGVFSRVLRLFKRVYGGVVENRPGFCGHPGIFDRTRASPLPVVRVLERQPPWPHKRYFLSSLLQIAQRVFSVSACGG